LSATPSRSLGLLRTGGRALGVAKLELSSKARKQI